jgi:hypothetical protein
VEDRERGRRGREGDVEERKTWKIEREGDVGDSDVGGRGKRVKEETAEGRNRATS